MKAVKVSSHKNEASYTFGDWMIYVERRQSSTYACGLRRTVSSSTWSAHNKADGRSLSFQSGGIKQAVARLSK